MERAGFLPIIIMVFLFFLLLVFPGKEVLTGEEKLVLIKKESSMSQAKSFLIKESKPAKNEPSPGPSKIADGTARKGPSGGQTSQMQEESMDSNPEGLQPLLFALKETIITIAGVILIILWVLRKITWGLVGAFTILLALGIGGIDKTVLLLLIGAVAIAGANQIQKRLE